MPMRQTLRSLTVVALFVGCNQGEEGAKPAGDLTLTAAGPAQVAGTFAGSGSAVAFDTNVQGAEFQVALTATDGSPLYRMARADGQISVEVLGRFSARFDPSAGNLGVGKGLDGGAGVWNDLQERRELLAIRALPGALDQAGLTAGRSDAARLLQDVARQVGSLLQVADVAPPEMTASRDLGDVTLTTQALSEECLAKKCTGKTHKVSLPGGGCTCRPNGTPPAPPPPQGPTGPVRDENGGDDHPGCSKVPDPETKCVVVSLWCKDHWKCPDPLDLRGRDESGSWYLCGACFGFDW
jgi:hypothetical protein